MLGLVVKASDLLSLVVVFDLRKRVKMPFNTLSACKVYTLPLLSSSYSNRMIPSDNPSFGTMISFILHIFPTVRNIFMAGMITSAR